MPDGKFLTVEGHRLECAWFGTPVGSDPVLVLLHDGLGSVSTWRAFPQQLAERTGLAVFVYSRAGYGGSSPAQLPRPVTFMHDEARMLPAVCAAADIRRAILVGHSDGASIALLHSGGDGTTTLDVIGLVLIAPHVFVEVLTVESIRKLTQSFEVGQMKRLAVHHADPERMFTGWTKIWLADEFRSWNIEACLPGIRVPVLLVQGDDDEFGTQRQLDKIERGVPGPVERHILRGCRHAPQRDAPDAVLEVMVLFVRQLAGKSPQGSL